MTITVAGAKFATRKPADLDAVLIAATGCNAAENAAILNGDPLAVRIAPAILPFLAEPPALSDLAVLVQRDLDGTDSTLLAEVRKLYAPVEPTPSVAATPAGGTASTGKGA